MWSLRGERGRMVWEYDPTNSTPAAKEQQAMLSAPFVAKENPNSADRVYRHLCETQRSAASSPQKGSTGAAAGASAAASTPAASLPGVALDAARKGIEYYQTLQHIDGGGCWPGDYGGPLFLMPGLVICLSVTGARLSEAHEREMLRYLCNHQHEDGGWGLHTQHDHSTMFGTATNYVAARLLGLTKDDPRAVRARNWIRKHGGAVSIPNWGKFWLSVLGVYEWDGMNSIWPELWLLPEALPVHPSRWWCHARMVYMPMGYCYAHRIVGPLTPLVESLREELYVEPYDSIHWPSQRSNIHKIDCYTPPSWLQRASFAFTNTYERCAPKFLRKRAADFLLDYVRAEDEQTNSICIGPVNKAINMLVIWHADGPDAASFGAHVSRVKDYLWLAEDGMKMQGYNGSQLWDTAFAVMGVVDSGLVDEFPECMQQAYRYVEMSQMRDNEKDYKKWYRHISKGGWPFSTVDHGWPIADCTGHGLEAALLLHDTAGFQPTRSDKISLERIHDAVDVMLSYQNTCGGWATYENTRGGAWLEKLNPSDVFGDIMIDYSYVELSSSAMQALAHALETDPSYRTDEVKQSLARGSAYIKKEQRDDGSWYGSWAVCFCYAVWFGVDGLLAAGETVSSPSIRRALSFLRSKQQDDGGWGESYKASEYKRYVATDSQVVNTAWAVLTLMNGDPGNDPALTLAIERGVRFLLSKQLPSGDWDQQDISGVFNANCMISYTAYRNVFPYRALGKFARKYPAAAAASKRAAGADGVVPGHSG